VEATTELAFSGTVRPPAFSDGAAYDPEDNSWTPIADSPFGWANNSAEVWTGSEWVVATTRRDGEGQFLEFMAYSPASNTWRFLPHIEAPIESETYLAWTGDDLIVRNVGTGIFRLASMSGEWQPLSPPPAGINSNLIWTGNEITAVTTEFTGGPDFRQDLIAWSPATETWQTLAAPPSQIQDITMIEANGHALFIESHLAYNFDDGSWSTLEIPDAGIRVGAAEEWMGSDLAIWSGGQGIHPTTPVNGGVLLHPAF
jgi:hypothetical protein